MTPEQVEWAEWMLGRELKRQGSPLASPAVSYELGARGRGCYFRLADGRKVYKQFPARLRSAPTQTHGAHDARPAPSE